MKNQPTPLKRHEVRLIRRYSLIVIAIVIGLSLLLSCSSTIPISRYDDVTRPNINEYYILEVEYPYVYVSGVDKHGERYEKYIFIRCDTLKAGGFLLTYK